MRAKLKAVQRLWRTMGVLSVVVALSAVYALTDIPKRAVVEELSRFEASFDAEAVSESLTQTARAQATTPLAAVAKAVQGPGVPETSAATGEIAPFGEVRLRTLGEADALREGGQVTMRKLNGSSLAKALSFRLARKGEKGPLKLTAVTLMPTTAKQAATDKLLAAEDARQLSVETRKRMVAAQGKAERLEELYEQRRKWKAPRKVLSRTWEKLSEARAERKTENDAWEQAFEKYQSAAEAALVEPKAAAAGTQITDMALAKVSIERPDGTTLSMNIPVPVEESTATLPPLTGIEFSQSRAQGLWGEVAQLPPAAAVSHAQATYGLMNRGVMVGPVRLSGLLVLQLLAGALPILLLLVIRRSASVRQSYNPFGQLEDLPRVGTGLSAIDFTLLSPLPTIAAGLATYALMRLGHLPIVALPATAAALILGIRAHGAVQELADLKAAVMRSSVPPAMPPDSSSANS